jgi:hypothetical protein
MTFIFDASPLNHFARAGQLHTLDMITKVAGRRLVSVPVLGELRRGIQVDPALRDIETCGWLEEVPVVELAELGAFAHYARYLGSGDRDIGEAATLAWAEVHGACAIVDDRPGTIHGRKRGVTVHGSLWLIAGGYTAQLLTERAAMRLVDSLLDTEAWFPCNGSTFFTWARENNLL